MEGNEKKKVSSNKGTLWKVLCVILCLVCLGGYKPTLDKGYETDFDDGLEQGKQIGTDVTTKDFEKQIKELNEKHSAELEETYKQGKKDGVANYKKKLKKRKEDSKKKKQKSRKKTDKKKQQEEPKAEQDTEESSLTSDLKDAWHKLTGEYVPTEDEIIDISTAQVLAEFEENQVACKQKYDGKYVRVTDTINSIGTTVWGDTYISIGSDVWDDIQCFMYKDQIDKVANCTEGTQVTVVGWVDCGSMNFKIGDARITNF